MRICHIALGGCLTAPNVNYGVTEDTGGHIAYVLGAAAAQANRSDVRHVQIITRAFEEPGLDPVHGLTNQILSPKMSIRRLFGDAPGYMAKEGLVAEIPALQRAFLAYFAGSDSRPDIIHAHFADAAVLALAARKMFGIPVVYTPHSLALSKADGLDDARRVAQERRALKECDATIVSSRDESDLQVTAYGPDLQARVHRVSPGVKVPRRPDPDRAARLFSQYLKDPLRPMILAIARPVARKNLSGLARLYARSEALQKQANLVILAGQHATAATGNAELGQELNAIFEALDKPALQGLVALPPAHDSATVCAVYDHAARCKGVFTNLAHHEPFGLTLLEAAAHGLPVVATDQGGPRDILSDIGCGVCVPVQDEASVEGALFALLTDDSKWSRAATAGRTGVARYDWSHWADRVQSIYRSTTRSTTCVSSTALLVSDIDGTLTGSRTAARRFGDWLSHNEMTFAVATGRSITEARRVLVEWELPEPAAFITSVGSELYVRKPNGRFTLDTAYAAQLDAGWDRAAVMACLKSLGFAFQPRVEQRLWKISGFGDADVASHIEAALNQRHIAARIIQSHGDLIDVVPWAGGKGKAVAALADRFGIAEHAVVVAGDSGNDADMLQSAGRHQGIGHGIVVGNALPELTDVLKNPAVYHARLPYAAGVLEGLAALSVKRGTTTALEAAE